MAHFGDSIQQTSPVGVAVGLQCLLQGIEVQDEGKTFVFQLRKGMKWFDGEPYTADDVLFNMQDLVFNNDFAPTPPRYMAKGEPAKVEKPKAPRRRRGGRRLR